MSDLDLMIWLPLLLVELVASTLVVYFWLPVAGS